jgi:hypothetical protein
MEVEVIQQEWLVDLLGVHQERTAGEELEAFMVAVEAVMMVMKVIPVEVEWARVDATAVLGVAVHSVATAASGEEEA